MLEERALRELETTTETDKVLKLSTANGMLKNNFVAQATIPILGDMTTEARVLKMMSRVLSVSELVDCGARFVWDENGAWLQYKGS